MRFDRQHARAASSLGAAALVLATLATLSLIGCDAYTANAGAAPDALPTATPTNEGPGLPVDHPPLELPPESRSTKRLSVDMLEASLPIVAGVDTTGAPITWTIKAAGNTQVPALADTALGRTLGRPDYAQTTEEPALPTPLYAKFMDDLARDVCAKMVAADAAVGESGTRTLTRFASLTDATDLTAIRANLRYLSLRLLGQKVADGDDDTVVPLLTLFQAAAGADDGTAGWTAVCVGLLTSPAFHIY
jgi:hypothetical protein